FSFLMYSHSPGSMVLPYTTLFRSQPEGKLRLMYEANPLAFIAEQAGGAATDGQQRILTRRPSSVHDRTPLIIGSRRNVEEVMALDRKSTRLNSSHVKISYAVFCLK